MQIGRSKKSELDGKIDELEYKIQDLKRRVAELRRKRPKPQVADYPFTDWNGEQATLSSLFGDKEHLILIHNMGKDCSYCTMWADGFNGLLPHLQSRAAFVVTSPDPPEVQKELALSRGWRFPMYCVGAESGFIADMAFMQGKSELTPGLSIFEKQPDGSILHVARSEFGPGDDYCPVWHLFALLPGGVSDWEPKFSY